MQKNKVKKYYILKEDKVKKKKKKDKRTQLKQCSKCKQWKNEGEFYLRKEYGTYFKQCKKCKSKISQIYYKKNKEAILKKVKQYSKEHPEINRKASKKYRDTHKKERCILIRNKRKNNIKYRLNQNISHAIYLSLKGEKGGRHWETLVDFTLEDLTKHLKTTIPEGMTWQDYLDGKLHIDHKIPVSVFNFDSYDHIDFRRCWTLENLQLLEAKENIRKSNKVEREFQPSLKI